MSTTHPFMTFKNRLAASASAVILVSASISGGLPLALQHAAADTNNVACQGDTTPSIAFPSAPEQLSPNTTSTYAWHADFNFSWTPVTGAAQYDWESSYSPDTSTVDGSFSRVLGSHTVTTTSIDQGDSSPTTYYWHVRAVDANGLKGTWSAVWNVTITPDQNVYLGSPALVSPSNNVIRNETKGGFFFMWNAPTSGVTGPLTYQYESGLSDETDPSTGHFTIHPYSESPGNNTYVYDNNTYNGTFYWHIRAIDANGTAGPWSETRVVRFSTAPRVTDTTAPTAVLDITPNRTFQPQQSFDIASTVTDNDGNNCDYTVTIRDQAGNVVYGPIANTQDITIHNDSQGQDLTDGTYIVTLDVWDASGNYSTTSRYIVIDDTNPVVSLTNPADNDSLHGTTTITGTVTDAHLASRTLYICQAGDDGNGNEVVIQDINDCWQLSDQSSAQNFTAQIDTRHFANGRYAIALIATDESDNTGGDIKFVTINNPAASTPVTNTTSNPTTPTPNTVTTSPQILTAASITTLNSDNTAVLGSTTTTPAKAAPKHSDHIVTTSAVIDMPNWFSQIWYWLVALLAVLGVGYVYDHTHGTTAKAKSSK